MKSLYQSGLALFIVISCLTLPVAATAQEFIGPAYEAGISADKAAERSVDLSRGQTIYVPVYSHTYIGEGNTQFNLTATLSFRNTDRTSPITVTAIDYYSSEGKLVRNYLKKPTILLPMASLRFTIQESDNSGGSGASFLATWQSAKPVSAPLSESIMIGTRQQQGISFISRGVVVSSQD